MVYFSFFFWDSTSEVCTSYRWMNFLSLCYYFSIFHIKKKNNENKMKIHIIFYLCEYYITFTLENEHIIHTQNWQKFCVLSFLTWNIINNYAIIFIRNMRCHLMLFFRWKFRMSSFLYVLYVASSIFQEDKENVTNFESNFSFVSFGICKN